MIGRVGFGRLNRPAVRRAAIAAPLVGAAVLASSYEYERALLRARPDRVSVTAPFGHSWYKYESRGLLRPPTVAAEASILGADEEVIGVVAGGRARAYRLGALRDRSSHLVNDQVGDVPVAVAYCDITNCVRAYTGPRGAGTLDVAVVGLYDGEMAVRLDGLLYSQKSGAPIEQGADPRPLPFGLLAPERTTWGRWKERHPESDVFEGGR